MLRHDDIAGCDKFVPLAHDFKGLFKQIARRAGAEIRETTITTERDEVKTSGLLIANEAPCHANVVYDLLSRVVESGPWRFAVPQVSEARPGAPSFVVSLTSLRPGSTVHIA